MCTVQAIGLSHSTTRIASEHPCMLTRTTAAYPLEHAVFCVGARASTVSAPGGLDGIAVPCSRSRTYVPPAHCAWAAAAPDRRDTTIRACRTRILSLIEHLLGVRKFRDAINVQGMPCYPCRASPKQQLLEWRGDPVPVFPGLFCVYWLSVLLWWRMAERLYAGLSGRHPLLWAALG